ncbi:hypothetical protein AHAS_Ahas13G0308500 [Arachis hypogaea]
MKMNQTRKTSGTKLLRMMIKWRSPLIYAPKFQYPKMNSMNGTNLGMLLSWSKFWANE